MQVASILDVSQAAVSKWEADLAFPRRYTVTKLEALFGADIKTLMSPAKTNGATPKGSAAPIRTNRRKGEDRDSHSTI